MHPDTIPNAYTFATSTGRLEHIASRLANLARLRFKDSMCRLSLLTAVICACSIMGCATRPPPTVPPPLTGPVQHVVVCWLKEPANLAHRQTLVDASLELRALPGVIDIVAGTMIPSDRDIVDSTFDVAIVITFTNADAMRAYLTNPAHTRMVQDIVKPLTRRILVYDFTEHPRR